MNTGPDGDQSMVVTTTPQQTTEGGHTIALTTADLSATTAPDEDQMVAPTSGATPTGYAMWYASTAPHKQPHSFTHSHART